MKIKKYASLGVLVLLVLSIMSGCSFTPQHKAITDTQFRHAMDVEGFTVTDHSAGLNSNPNPLYKALYGTYKASFAIDNKNNVLKFVTCEDSASAANLYLDMKDSFNQSIDSENSSGTNTQGTTEHIGNYTRYTRLSGDSVYSVIQVDNTVIASAAFFSDNTHIEDIIQKLGY